MDPELAQTDPTCVEDSRRKHRTGLVTLLFTDIVGSTALKQQLGDKAGAALIQEQRALVRQLLATCPGAEEIERPEIRSCCRSKSPRTR